MDDQFVESRRAVAKAREALRLGDQAEARIWAERAAELAPGTEDPWLILAALSDPEDGLAYARKALEVNPDSARARKGLDWALERAGQKPASPGAARAAQSASPFAQSPARVESGGSPKPRKKRSRTGPIFAVLLLLGGCVVVIAAAWSATASPAFAAILSRTGWQPILQEPPPPPQFWANAEIPKPTYAPPALATGTLASLAALGASDQESGQPLSETDTPAPSATHTLFPEVVEDPATATPEWVPTLDYTVTPDANATPGVLVAEIVPDTPTSEYVAPTAAVFQPAPVANVGGGEHWIDVDLSQQRVYAFAGDTVVNSFVVSTGTWQTPTVTGQYHVWIKLKSTTMAGPGYYLTNVPWVMYFYKGYGLHGTYWHNNFGTPMSHGCVNLTIPDAEWLYHFASVGTLVNVHY